jgi:Pvc16 N-terminal domain/Carboxypeptidase regulatory-like domain
MFDDLDATLTQLLTDAPLAELPELHNADVSFITPDKGFGPGQATVDLFLYEVRENRELRDPRPIVERNGDSFTRRLPPLRADCSYIVTTWDVVPQGGARVAAEHRLLGQALTWLSRFPTIPDVYLQGLLGSPDRIYPPPALAAQLDPNQHAGDFWVAMGIAPRPAFYLTVTVELELAKGQALALPVTTRFTEFVVDGALDRPWVQIGGRVVDVAAAGVAGAVVDIVDLELRTRTAEEGRYSFPRVPPGAHTIRVVAPGFQPQTQPLVVPGGPDDYRVALTPLP